MKTESNAYAELIRQTRHLSQASRKDLSDAVNNARSTVGRQVDQLVKANYLVELGPEAVSSAGRPRILLELNPDAGCFFGIDFEARSLFGVAVDFAQNTIARHTITHQQVPTTAHLIHSIKQLLQHLQGECGKRPALAIGLGVPGHVDPESGMALHYEHIKDWNDVPLAEEISRTFHIPVFLENNTRTMILGERWFGNAAGCDQLICLNVRTGLSVAVITDGHLLRGSQNLAGEIRGWPAPSQDPTSAPVSLETIGSLSSILEPYAGEGNDLTAAWIRFTDQLQSKNPQAQQKLADIAIVHGKTIANLAQLLNPEKVILTGPLSEIGDHYLDQVKTASEQALQGIPLSPPVIQLSKLGLYSGAIGASALALQHWVPDIPA
ncbi:MAG: ROK family protein [Verrucomicrobiales bacterium]|nr:ROK family protein [Verrucomicrobiales bacterium]